MHTSHLWYFTIRPQFIILKLYKIAIPTEITYTTWEKSFFDDSTYVFSVYISCKNKKIYSNFTIA